MDSLSNYLKESVDPRYHIFLLLGAVVLGFVLGMLFYLLIQRSVHRAFDVENKKINKYLKIPFFSLFGLVVAKISFPLFHFSGSNSVFLSKTLFILIVLSCAWLIARVLGLVSLIFEKRFDVSETDNMKSRKVHTQFSYIKKLLLFILFLITISVILLSFKSARQVGISILASAGVTTLVIGLAAQKTIGNLLAGFQIAFTQPIRIDDVVIVESEYGRVEEITLTYVVVKVWDERRIILPLSYFIENPFQNWTRKKADLLGSVFIWVDYTFPVEDLRSELDRILEDHPLWDKKVKNLVVTESTAEGMQLRALVSAKDSGSAWDLRCDVREKLITFIQKNYPGSLPRKRHLVAETK